jgi:hypothetical protein
MDMRRFLIAGRPDGQTAALANLGTLVRERRPDGVLFVGGLLETSSPAGADKLKKWDACLAGLGQLGVFTALVPGSAEVPLRDFLRLAKDAELAFPSLHVAHATLFAQGDTAFCGVGGELTEAEDRTEDRLSCARATAEYFLRTLRRADQPNKILLLSVAPPGQLGGDAGNRICGDFIDSHHPSLCVVAGTTERRGWQRIARTLVVNPGRLADGSLAWLDWNRPKDEQVELLRL